MTQQAVLHTRAVLQPHDARMPSPPLEASGFFFFFSAASAPPASRVGEPVRVYLQREHGAMRPGKERAGREPCGVGEGTKKGN